MGGIARAHFLLLNALGALLFSAVFVGAGYLFSSRIERILATATGSGRWFIVLSLATFALYLGIKFARRTRFARLLRLARISVEELQAKIQAKEDVAIIDLRHPLDFQAAPLTLPGAVRLAPEEVAHRHQEIPRDRDIVLYCTCPNEHSSARVAMLLKRYGISRVRPLAGGYEAWIRRGLPVFQTRSLNINAIDGPLSAQSCPGFRGERTSFENAWKVIISSRPFGVPSGFLATANVKIRSKLPSLSKRSTLGARRQLRLAYDPAGIICFERVSYEYEKEDICRPRYRFCAWTALFKQQSRLGN